jgi:hypothetical protein
MLQFGADPGSLPAGEYRIRAVLDTAKKKGMWNGKVESSEVKLIVRKKLERLAPKDSLLRDYLYGRFYVLDQQYPKVETYAARLLAADPNSINAWELRGDAMAGSGDLVRAEAAFKQALANFDAKYRGKPMEPPDYLIRRYNEVRAGKP